MSTPCAEVRHWINCCLMFDNDPTGAKTLALEMLVDDLPGGVLKGTVSVTKGGSTSVYTLKGTCGVSSDGTTPVMSLNFDDTNITNAAYSLRGELTLTKPRAVLKGKGTFFAQYHIVGSPKGARLLDGTDTGTWQGAQDPTFDGDPQKTALKSP
jgi:hypothetical protein